MTHSGFYFSNMESKIVSVGQSCFWTDFMKYDVFISYSSKDRDSCITLAKRLVSDGIVVWLDEWNVRYGENIVVAIDEGLKNSRTLILLLSPYSVAAEWPNHERSTRQFRDPKNQGLQFLPVLLDVCDLPETLKPLKYVDYCSRSESAYSEILSACCPTVIVQRLPEFTKIIVTQPDITSDDARSLWEHRLSSADRRRVVIDLGKCPFYSSGTHGALFSLRGRIIQSGGKVALYNLSEDVSEVYKMLRLDRMYKIFASCEEAGCYVNSSDD